MGRGVAIKAIACYLLLVAVLGILSICESLSNVEHSTGPNHTILEQSLGIELKRVHLNSAFRYFFLQVI